MSPRASSATSARMRSTIRPLANNLSIPPRRCGVTPGLQSLPPGCKADRTGGGPPHDRGQARTAMTGLSIAQPDVTLFLDLEGVIRDVELSTAVPERGVEAWRGRPWAETVLDVGGDKVRRMVEDARTHGVSGFRQVTQRFPSGLELPVEYTTVRLGGKGGLVAIGKNLQAVAELQSRLIAAQQAMERDYWKLREIETRYRLLFDASTEAVLLVRASNLRVVGLVGGATRGGGEATRAATGAWALPPAGRDLRGELAPADREPFQAMLV